MKKRLASSIYTHTHKKKKRKKKKKEHIKNTLMTPRSNDFLTAHARNPEAKAKKYCGHARLKRKNDSK